jgi:hypothetical protein
MGDPLRVTSPSSGRSRQSIVVDVAIVAAAFLVAAALVPASLLVSFAVLLGAGVAIGLRGSSDRRPIAIGSLAGAALVAGWTALRELPSDVSAALRNGLASALLLGLILGGALVLPGSLFGRAFRRSRDASVPVESNADVGDRAQVASDSLRSDIGGGVLILAAFAAVIVYLMAHPLGP